MARAYGQIQSAFWTHPTIRNATVEAKVIAAYLLTGPDSNGIGCFFAPPETMAGTLRMSAETVSKGLGELSRNGFLKRCATTDYVFIPNFLKWNEVSNTNVAKARVKELQAIPTQFAYLSDLIEDCKRFVNHWPKGFETLCQTLCQTRSNSEPNRSDPIRSDPEPNPTEGATPPVAGEPRPEGQLFPSAIAEVFDFWAQTFHPNAKLDDKRRACIRKALKDGYSVDELKMAIFGCSRTPHNMGDNDRGQRYDALTLILRNGDQIDRFIGNAKDPPRPSPKDESPIEQMRRLHEEGRL